MSRKCASKLRGEVGGGVAFPDKQDRMLVAGFKDFINEWFRDLLGCSSNHISSTAGVDAVAFTVRFG